MGSQPMEHAVFISSFVTTLALVGATLALERRRPLIARRDPERALAVFGYLLNPIIWRMIASCWLREAAVISFARALMIFLWMWRCDERLLTFPSEYRAHRVAMIAAGLSTAAAGVSGWLGCDAAAQISAFTFAAAWTLSIAFSYRLEREIPRAHRERELVLVAWACWLAPAVAMPYFDVAWNDVASSVAQMIMSLRLLGPHVRLAISTDESSGPVYETIYKMGGEIRNGVEALNTPLEASFLAHCATRDAPATREYTEALDHQLGAVLAVPPPDPVSAIARRLDRAHWADYAKNKSEPPRAVHALDESDDDEDTEGEVVYGSLSDMEAAARGEPF